jgi:hypothetical protein
MAIAAKLTPIVVTTDFGGHRRYYVRSLPPRKDSMPFRSESIEIPIVGHRYPPF